ncbi:MAG: hypothetical protein V4613_10095 [Bacteroidota bacterium]
MKKLILTLTLFVGIAFISNAQTPATGGTPPAKKKPAVETATPDPKPTVTSETTPAAPAAPATTATEKAPTSTGTTTTTTTTTEKKCEKKNCCKKKAGTQAIKEE